MRSSSRAVLALAVLLVAGCDSSTAGRGTAADPAPSTAGQPSGAPTAGSPTGSAPGSTGPGSSGPGSSGPGSSGPGSSGPGSTAPGGPSAADGTNVAACKDARCEVAVRPGTALPVPTTTTVRDIRVTAVTGDRVTITGRAIGDASSGYCSGQCDSSTTNGVFTVTLGVDSQAVENGLAITAEHIEAGTAVLKLEPAG
jgi:hypothetical protein